MIIKITIDKKQINSLASEIASKVSNTKPAFNSFGDYFTKKIETQFKKEIDPFGAKWKDLSPATWKQKQTPKILTETYLMRSSFKKHVGKNEKASFRVEKVEGKPKKQKSMNQYYIKDIKSFK